MCVSDFVLVHDVEKLRRMDVERNRSLYRVHSVKVLCSCAGVCKSIQKSLFFSHQLKMVYLHEPKTRRPSKSFKAACVKVNVQ